MKFLEKVIEYGFYLFLFLLPWQTRLIWQDASLNGFTWEYGRLSLYGTQIILWLILFLYFFWLLKNKKISAGGSNVILNFKNRSALVYWVIFLFVLICGLSVFWSLDSQLAYYRWFVLVQAVATMSMLLVFNFDYKKIAIAFVLAAVGQSVFAIWQFFNQLVPANKWLGLALHLPNLAGSIVLQTNSERWLRAYGSLPHPNILGGFLNIAFWFLLYLAYQAKSAIQRFFILLAMVLIIPGLFFSFSRSAWVGFAFGLFLFFVWVILKNNAGIRSTFLKVLFVLILIFVALLWNFKEPFLGRLKSSQDLEVTSISARLTLLGQAKALVFKDSLLGTGIGNYTLGVFKKIDSTFPGYYYQPVHNIYVLILAEVGILGFLPFLAFLAILFWSYFKKIGQTQSAIFLAGLISILVISLFDHYFWTIETGVILFWLMVGLNLKQLRS